MWTIVRHDGPDDLELWSNQVVIHEVGHTLGLRHNFMAAATGNTSVMDYHDGVVRELQFGTPDAVATL